MMMLQQSQSDMENLEKLFASFMQSLLTRMELWITIGRVPKSHHRILRFYERSYWPTYEEKKDYLSLFIRHRDDPIWSMEEANLLARSMYVNKLIPQRVIDSMLMREGLTIETLTSSDIAFLVASVLTEPAVDLIERYTTFQPTQTQIKESYQRFLIEWTEPFVHEIAIPLLNFTFSGTLRREEAIGTRLCLTPLTPEEKTDIWNFNTRFEASSLPIDFGAFQNAQFKLAWSYSRKGRVFGNRELSSELYYITSALRLLKPGHVSAPALVEKSQFTFSWFSPRAISLERPEERQWSYPWQSSPGVTYILEISAFANYLLCISFPSQSFLSLGLPMLFYTT